MQVTYGFCDETGAAVGNAVPNRRRKHVVSCVNRCSYSYGGRCAGHSRAGYTARGSWAGAVRAVVPDLVAQLVYGLARGAVWAVDGLYTPRLSTKGLRPATARLWAAQWVWAA